MKKPLILILMLALISGTSFAFLSNNDSETTISSANYAAPQDADAKYPKGAKIYKEKCVACHQLTGAGVPGAFPPLKGSDYLKADLKRAVQQVINGNTTPIEVNGATYAIPMPPQVDNHEDAVAVINYVANSWGNAYGEVKVADVKDIKIVR